MVAPTGTRAWRKGYRKRWREDSTFRDLSPLAKLAVVWVEENADDEGTAVVTVRQMAAYVGGRHHKQRVHPMAMWRAWREAERAGLLVVEVGQPSSSERDGVPSRITRTKFREYQSRDVADVTGTVTALDGEALHSGRRSQKKQKKRSVPINDRNRSLGPSPKEIGSAADAAQPPLPRAPSTTASRDLGRILGLLAAEAAFTPLKHDAPADKGALMTMLRKHDARAVYAAARTALHFGANTIHGGLSRAWQQSRMAKVDEYERATARSRAETEWECRYGDTPHVAGPGDGGATQGPGAGASDSPPLPDDGADLCALLGTTLGSRRAAGIVQDPARVEHGGERGAARAAGAGGEPGTHAR